MRELGLCTCNEPALILALLETNAQAYAVKEPSPPGAVDLARRLREAGARMYGAFWCSHCQEQKQAFGQAAMAEFPYQECYPEGWALVRHLLLPQCPDGTRYCLNVLMALASASMSWWHLLLPQCPGGTCFRLNVLMALASASMS